MIDPIYAHAKSAPNATAILTESDTISYLDLHHRVSATAHKVAALKTNIIAFRAQDTLSSLIVIWACLRAKKLCFPLNPTFPDDYIQGFLHHAGISHTTEIHTLITKENNYTDHHSPTLSLDQLCSIIATSGSSGTPKLAVHSLGNHVVSAKASQNTIPLHPKDTWLLNLPLFHVSGLSILFRCFIAGASISLDPTQPYSHSSVVPTQLQRLLDEQNTQFLNSTHCLVGGAALPPNLTAALPKKPMIHTTYGLTEMSTQVITDNTVLASAETSIDPDTQELYVKGPSLFQGYLSNGLLTLPLNKAGFFNTKDRICFKNGDFQYLGRQDRLIISGGENIQPEEIETVLLKHPKVHRAAVVGIPDKTFGERPIAFLETDDIPSIRAEIEALLERLPKFKRPDKFLPLPNIGATEKISFKNLRIYGQNTI